MKIYGIGIDMIEIKRIRTAVERRRTFLDKIFSEKEIKLSDRGRFRFEELAGRFAVKEAVLKSIKTGWRRGITFHDVIVLNEPSGAPYVLLEGQAKKHAANIGIKEFHISISHTKELAVGMAIALV